jgi:4a-hydroxytetrahydrobiopterin dehydratase
MARPKKLNKSDVAKHLSSLPAWKVVGGKLHRNYEFQDFVAAFGFMTSAALVAQAMDHHPEWRNVWNRVVVDLTTHDAKGITTLDFQLAAAMEALALQSVPDPH